MQSFAERVGSWISDIEKLTKEFVSQTETTMLIYDRIGVTGFAEAMDICRIRRGKNGK